MWTRTAARARNRWRAPTATGSRTLGQCLLRGRLHCVRVPLRRVASLYGDEDGGPTWMPGSESAALLILIRHADWDTAGRVLRATKTGGLCTYDQMCATDNRFGTTVANHADFGFVHRRRFVHRSIVGSRFQGHAIVRWDHCHRRAHARSEAPTPA